MMGLTPAVCTSFLLAVLLFSATLDRVGKQDKHLRALTCRADNCWSKIETVCHQTNSDYKLYCTVAYNYMLPQRLIRIL